MNQSRFSKIRILAQAAMRMNHRMRVFMVRRLLRNALSPYLPFIYRDRYNNTLSLVPPIPRNCSSSPASRDVLHLYCSEYRHQIDHIINGRLIIHGRQIDFGSTHDFDWNITIDDEGDHQMWRVKLNHMGFLAPMLAYGDQTHHKAALNIIDSFRELDRPGTSGFFGPWFPYAVSHRILALTSALVYCIENNRIDNDVYNRFLEFIRFDVAFLLHNIEHELFNNHVERNISALCFYFSFTNNVPTTIAKILIREAGQIVSGTILPDGTQIERSPMYQALSVVALSVMAETPFLPQELREEMIRAVVSARRALAILCHPDGKVALFNDSWHGETPGDHAPPAPDGRSVLEFGGYARLSHKNDVCILDAGALGPAWNPGHGHADFLSLEISLGGHRLIVDPGTSGYSTGADRARERSAEAHNGPIWLGHEPVEFLGCFKVGRMAAAEFVATDKLQGELTVGGTFSAHSGYAGRIVQLYPDIGFLVVDGWGAASPEGRVSWLIPTEWEIKLETAHRANLNHFPSGTNACIELLSEGELPRPNDALWSSHYGRRNSAWEIRMRPRTSDGAQTLVCWIGHTVAPRSARANAEVLTRHLLSVLNAK